jgi:putative ABC transport system ATP-binding protein
MNSGFVDKKLSQSASSEPLLRLDKVSRAYEDGKLFALNEVSLAIWPGEYIAIMGPSGSGKSTLLNLLGALDRPTTGTILFEGKSLFDSTNLDLFRAKKLGFVFQSFHLIPTLTSLENVQVPMFAVGLPPRKRAEKATLLLELVGMSHRSAHLPAKLSVGERQRVAIARALANEPSLLLADEPTGNLDSASGEIVLELFDRLHRERGLTLAVITHDENVAQRAQRTIRIRDGRTVNS